MPPHRVEPVAPPMVRVLLFPEELEALIAFHTQVLDRGSGDRDTRWRETRLARLKNFRLATEDVVDA